MGNSERNGARPSTGLRAVAWWAAACAALVLMAAAPERAAAQQLPATPPLQTDHWAYAALDRLASADLLGGAHSIGERPRSTGAVAWALRRAARAASREKSPLGTFAANAWERFRSEFPEALGSDGSAGARIRREISFRFGSGAEQAVVDRGDRIGLELSTSLGSHLALLYEPELRFDGADGLTAAPARLAVVGKLGPVWASLGRRRVGFGPGAGGGLVLNDAAAFDGLVASTDRAVRLPGIGRALGPIRATMLLTRMGPDTLGPASWLAGARVSFAPHPRVQVGLNRTALVGLERGGDRAGAKDLFYVVIGKHVRPNMADHRASLDARVRFDAGPVPIVSYVEWGFEDSAGAYIDDPGLSAGLFLPFLPGLPTTTLRYEYTAFGDDARVCWFCASRVTRWYRHGFPRHAYLSGEGVPLGHPLGGYGRGHRLEARVWLLDARLQVGTTLLHRNRKPLNLLYTERPGPSRGLGVRIGYRLAPLTEIDMGMWLKQGREVWYEQRAWIGARARF